MRSYSRIIGIVIFFLGGIFITFHVPHLVALGQQSGWSTPELLSLKGTTSWFPDLAVDPAGNVHIVWGSGLIPYDLVVYTNNNTPDHTFRPPLEIQALVSEGEATRPTLFASPDGILHATFRDTIVYYSQVHALNAYSARTWKERFRISEGYFSDVAVDSKGVVHLVFTRNVVSSFCLVCYHTYYLRSFDGGNTWSEEIDISLGPLGSAKPQILVDHKDNIHVVWESGIGGGYGQLSDTEPTQVFYVASYDNGETWERPIQLNPTEMVAKFITIGLDSRNRIVVVWMDANDDSIYFQISNVEKPSWSVPLKIPEVRGIWSKHHGRLDDYTMASDSAGNVHLVMVGWVYEKDGEELLEKTIPTEGVSLIKTPTITPTALGVQPKTQLSLLHLVWNGVTWSKPEIIAEYEGDVPEWPRISVGLGNQLHVVWFVRAERDIWKGGGDYTVWYSKKVVNAPSYSPAVLPTVNPTSTSSPDFAQNLLPEYRYTDTPVIPPFVKNADPMPDEKLVYKEMDYIEIAIISTVPVIFFVFLFFLISRKIRRF